MLWEIITMVTTILALITSILIAGISVARESRTRFIDNFNKLYTRTFSFRKQMSSLTKVRSNEEFFYEIDRILCSEEIQDSVLDYLTEMENFFFLVIGHRSVYQSFEKLMSLPLYQRLSVFYGYILRLRMESKNYKLFLNYEQALQDIGNMKKIKAQFPTPPKRYYIGIRSSDCMYGGDYFQADISIFSGETGPKIYPTRPNQNKTNKKILPYITNKIDQTIKQYPECQFVFYNGAMAYNLPSNLHQYFICLNSRELLQWLNNKSSMKQWLSNGGIPVLPYETFLGQEITLNMLKQRFPRTEQYVIQCNNGGGGIGTFLVSCDCFDKVQPLLQPLRQYLVSAYVKYGVSVNTHIFIADKQTVLSPGSVQIIEQEQGQLCYRGADFIAFRTLPSTCRSQVRDLSLKIANRLREVGYRGVAGLDFFVTRDGEIYCMEINPRFQASSVLLDMYLQQNKIGNNTPNSIFALNEQAFSNRMTTTLCFNDIIDYSCYFYYKGNLPLEFLIAKRNSLSQEGVVIHDDGFLQFAEENLLDEDSYLFRAIFPHAICAVSPDMTLWLNDNIPVRQAPKDLMDLKIALLNQGITLKGPHERVKKGTYESIDISYQGPLCNSSPVAMNCAYKVNLSQYSPFSINISDRESVISYYGTPLGSATIEENQLTNLTQTDQRILYLATDRLRIKLLAGCEYKNIGCGCRFCNLPMSDKRFTHEELKGALLRLKGKQIPFRHILIGGGTCLAPDIWDDIVWLCHFLKSDDYYKDKPISLMSVLPPIEMLSVFRDAGLEEVAFNMEMTNDDMARKLMPGKCGQSKSAYYTVLESAIQVFGIGAVRSALIVGLDQEDQLVDEVLKLAQMGVIPCLSAFRALPGSEFGCAIHPDNATLRRIYDTCSIFLRNMNGPITELGPKCQKCRNNMLAI